MRIGIDASRAFGEQRTGTENYSFQMIKHLLALPQAKDHEWLLYVKSQISRKKIQTGLEHLDLGHWKLRVIEMTRLWTQIGLASRTWTDNLDVLWIPAHTLPILRKPGLKTVVTIHGIEYEYLPAYENILQRWYLPLSTSYAVFRALKIIAVSQFTAKQIEERLGGHPAKIQVVYEGVEMKFQVSSLKTQEVLKKHNLKSKKYILFIGTIQPRKNLKRLIEAFRGLKAQASSLNLVLVGKLGWGYEDLPIDQQPNIKFLRYISDAERDIILVNALVYVQPSITEGFGLPILESFAAGIPVVSSNGGALPEIAQITNPKTQETNLFDPYKVDQMRQVLQHAIDSPEWRKELITLGTEKLKQFSWQKAARQTYKILTEDC